SPATDFHLLIDGRLVAGAMTFDVINPATEEVLAACPRADVTQLNQAVAAAKAAYPQWAAKPLSGRKALLVKLADELERRIEQLAPVLTQEQGKPLGHAAYELHGAVAMIRAFTTMDLPVKVLKETDTARILQQRTPLGVVAAITPWNFPMILLMI